MFILRDVIEAAGIEGKPETLAQDRRRFRDALADSYGGSYFDANLGKLVVGTTDAAKSDEVRADGAEPRQVAASERPYLADYELGQTADARGQAKPRKAQKTEILFIERIWKLLKPGGVLFLSTFDTEGLIYLFSERKRMAQNFRTHLILYSRSALIELLEHSGYEIVDIGPDFEYRDQKLVRHWLHSHHPLLAPFARAILKMLPDPMIVSTGSIRIVAKRRAGMPLNVRAIRSVEPTHAR